MTARKKGAGLVLVVMVVGLLAALLTPAGASAPAAVNIDKTINVAGIGLAKTYANDAPVVAQARLERENKNNEVKGYTFAYKGFAEGEQLFRYLRDTFDQLCEEGRRMMSVGLHGRIAGRPARARAVAPFVDHALASGQAWIARRIDIARHWIEVHPA